MTEKTFRTPCGVIHYWTNEFSPAHPALVFLPGLTADHRLFDKQVAAFQDKYRVLVWDAPGHGASRPFRLEFSLADKAGYLREILRQEKIERPILVGQSMGGYVAQCYMDQFPDSAVGFISIDSAPLKREYITAAELWLLKRTEPMYRAFPWKLLALCGSRGCAVSVDGRRLMNDMMSSFDRDEYCRLAGHGFRILAEAIEQGRPYDIPCPTLLICGIKDRAGSAKRYNKSWARRAGLPILWVDAAGHNSNCDQPEIVNRAIETFIKERGEHHGV
ncbi:MAG: alpha/beta hydrolase [Oscillospiraceae bacterium]|jgi:pimeloyl-ACP methyl ester carboxylesterase|nr:alpha/beta hydrolase [Oscillospiraceae bacterium]